MSSRDRHPQPSGELIPSRLRICGVCIDTMTLDNAVDRLVHRTVVGHVHLCNAYTLSLVAGSRKLQEVLDSSSLNLPDGMPLVWIARHLGQTQLTERVYGPDLMEATLDRGRATELRHYLYGSTPETLFLLEQRIAERWPGTWVVGREAPPIGTIDMLDLPKARERILASRADIVWVCLGTPKQDIAVEALANCPGPALVAVGAAFDFIAGTKRQAPNWVRRSGFEWLYRLLSEPRRLWRRYLIGNAKFIYATVRTRPSLEARD